MTDDGSAGIRSCYGEEHDCDECRVCGIRAYCRDFAASERSLAVGQSRVTGIEEWIPAPLPERARGRGKRYSHDDLLRVVCFFLSLTETEIRIIQLRIRRPELRIIEIAQELNVTKKFVYEFFKKGSLLIPGLRRLLYRQRGKRK
ncbi:MAG: hypothetical protein IJU70_11985 [Lentisphaeria bacterium]|nr:hypothetical protein [Lentisphaeria bacterium]